MTDRDLQTCRDWCRANGVEVRTNSVGAYYVDGPYWFCCHPDLAGFHKDENMLNKKIGMILLPIIQSVRNLDAAEVEGPYKVNRYSFSDGWHVESDDDGVECKTEQTARTIASLLNRECQ